MGHYNLDSVSIDSCVSVSSISNLSFSSLFNDLILSDPPPPPVFVNLGVLKPKPAKCVTSDQHQHSDSTDTKPELPIRQPSEDETDDASLRIEELLRDINASSAPKF